MPLSQQSANGASDASEAATPISFEARIALALQGNNWQELQKPTNHSATVQEEIVDEEAADEDEEESEDDDADEEVETGDSTDAAAADEPKMPPVLSAKQKRKRKQFAQAIERDAGGILHTIDLESLVPVATSVTWDGDPELLCCYNWQASTDNTNTIFGKLRCDHRGTASICAIRCDIFNIQRHFSPNIILRSTVEGNYP